MLIRIAVAAVALSATCMLVTANIAHADFQYECIGKFDTACEWELVDGTPGPRVPASGAWQAPAVGGVLDPCVYWPADPQPPPDHALWGSGDPEHGRLWMRWCPPDPDFDYDESTHAGAVVAVRQGQYGPYYVADTDTPDLPGDTGEDSRDLVWRAIGRLSLPDPQPVIGPNMDEIAVKVPVQLAVAPFTPVQQTARAGNLVATVTAELDSVTWTPGEPVKLASRKSASPFTCTAAESDPANPQCSYTYIWRSLPERTAGAGTWPLETVSHYRLTWTVTTAAGQSVEQGEEQVDTRTTTPLLVRQWTTTLINNMPAE